MDRISSTIISPLLRQENIRDYIYNWTLSVQETIGSLDYLKLNFKRVTKSLLSKASSVNGIIPQE